MTDSEVHLLSVELPLLLLAAVGVVDGSKIVYVSNDGTENTAVAINGKYYVWGVKDTKFRNGDLIHYIRDNADWSSLATAGMCLYNNQRFQLYDHLVLRLLQYKVNLMEVELMGRL